MFDDDEFAERIATARDAQPGPGHFGLLGWTPERELLVGLTEAVLSLRSVLIGVNHPKGKAPKTPSLPRPRTAVDRIEAIRRKSRRSELLAVLVPHADPV